jgi:hypothetical protein
MASALLKHTTALYHALDAAATTETVNGSDTRVFRGSIVETFRSIGISQSYYSEVRKGLLKSESISILQQGSKNAKSVIVLHKEPSEESLETIESLGLTEEAEPAIVLQELRDLKRLIGSISVPDALVNIERRLQEFDNRITKVEQLVLKQNTRQGR